ncbi:hypothetical protein GCM10027167_85470 [Nocardia heshunensis]
MPRRLQGTVDMGAQITGRTGQQDAQGFRTARIHTPSLGDRTNTLTSNGARNPNTYLLMGIPGEADIPEMPPRAGAMAHRGAQCRAPVARAAIHG